MKNYFLHIDSFGVPLRVYLNQVKLYDLESSSGILTKIPVNEWIKSGENLLSIRKLDGEILEDAEVKIEILTANDFPKEDEAYQSVASITDHSLPINLAPFVTGPMWFDSLLERAQEIDVTDTEMLSRIKELTLKVHAAFKSQDLDAIVKLMYPRFGQYDKAYGFPEGNREAEFRKVIKSYYSSAELIIMKEELLAPRPHFFGKLVDMYYPKWDFNTVVFYDDVNSVDHIIEYYIMLNENNELEIVR